jgi:hypothetical protein
MVMPLGTVIGLALFEGEFLHHAPEEEAAAAEGVDCAPGDDYAYYSAGSDLDASVL